MPLEAAASNENLPFGAERISAPEKRFQETVVFVHHFAGSRKTVLRHLRFVNQLGFDAVRFDLLFNDLKPRSLPLTADLRFGVRYVWAEQIEAILNAIPGKKILYSFSMPSNATLRALGRRRASDVSAWVCDGGPFLKLPLCTWNLFEHEYHMHNRIALTGVTLASLAWFGPGARQDAKKSLDLLPVRFPILSVRGDKDPLVPVSAIDAVFKMRAGLNLEKLQIENGGHLDGIKVAPDLYTATVRRFLINQARENILS